MVDALVLSRTVRIASAGHTGTAVYLQSDDLRFLLTAAHVVAGAAAGDKLGIRFSESWQYVEILAVLRAPDNIDAAIILTTTHWGEGLPVEMLNAEIYIGEDAAFCGFPLGLEMQGMPDSRGWPTALVKSATFSGAVKIADQTTYLFDATNNLGFSGGPVVRPRQGNRPQTIIGIVSAYKYDAPQPVMQKDEHGQMQPTQSYFVRPNSGFMYVVPAFQFRPLIEAVYRASASAQSQK